MPERLTREQMDQVAHQYGVAPAALCAVTRVESSGSGYLPNGQPKILFERHVLWKRLQIPGRGIDPNLLAAQRPDLCGRRWDRRYYLGGVREYSRVADVILWGQRHDPSRWEGYKKAAYESCSWGLFQLMGFHYRTVGYDDIYKMVHKFRETEVSQLDAIMKFLVSSGGIGPLRNQDWRTFAFRYNGSGQVDLYATRLRQAYVACSQG